MAVATEREYGLFINGESTEPASGEVRELSEPATGEPLARVASAGEEDVDRAVEAAQAALDGDWGKTPGTERSRLLHALADAITANRKELAELESRNVGKAISSVKAEIAGAAENFRFYASAIATIGGRSGPVGGSLLFADADLADAIPASVWAIYASAGQSCEARSRLLVEQSIYDDVAAQVTELAQRVKVGDPLESETQMGSLISTSHREKVHGFVEGARA